MDLIHAHPAISALVAFYLFSSIVSGMPDPRSNGSALYLWAFNTLHILSANLNQLVASKYPQLPPGSMQSTKTETLTVTPPKG